MLKKKNLLTYATMLALCSLSVPSFAIGVNDYPELTVEVGNGSDITLNSNIAAWASHPRITNTAASTTITLTADQFINGPTTAGGVIDNTGTLSITGASGASINTGNGSTPATANSGTLNLNYIQVGGGVAQASGETNILGGTVVFSGSTTNFTGGDLNITGAGTQLTLDGGTVAAATDLNIGAGTILANSNAALTINSADTWTGSVSMSGGSTTLDGVTSNGAYSQTGGSLSISDASGTDSTLSLAAGSSITGGNVGFVGTGNTISVSGGNLGSGATVNLSSGNNLSISSGSATLNSADTWAGDVSMSGGSTTLDGVTSNGAYSQTGGSLSISDASGTDSTLSLAAGSSITGGNVGFVGTGNTLSVSGGNLGSSATVNLSSGNNLSISSGSATLDSTDTWAGDVSMSGGSTTLDNVTHTASAANGAYAQTGGTLNLTNASSLTLSSGSTVTGGTLSIADTSALTISNAASNNATVNASGGNLTLSGAGTQLTLNGGTVASGATLGIGAGTTLANSNAALTINSADTWTGSVSMSGGSTILDGVTSNGAYSQTGGSLSISDASGTDSTLSLAAGSSITGGNVGFVGTGNTISVSGGSLGSGATVNLSSGNNLSISSGSATLNSADTWAGDVSMSGGTFNLNNISHDATVGGNGSYSQTGGTINLEDGAHLKIANTAITGAGSVANVSSTTGTNSNLEMVYSSNTNYSTAVNLNGKGTLTLNTGSNTLTNTSNTLITGSGLNNLLVKEGSGTYLVDRTGAAATFDYGINVNAGTMEVKANSANFNDEVNVNSSTLTVASDTINFNNGLILSNGTFNVENRGFNVTAGGLSVGSTVDTMNGVIATNNITGDLNVGASGVADFLIDISPRSHTSDKYVISGDITKTGANGTINISDFNVLGLDPVDSSIRLQIFDASGTVDPAISFTQTNKVINTAIGKYSLFSQGGGAFNFSLTEFNPAVFRGQVATMAAYANQLTTNSILFDHIGLVSQQLLADTKANMYANENPLYAPYQYSQKDGGLWFKAFGNLERLQLTQNINTQNNMWGSLVGADFPIVELSKGWRLLPTAYVGYTGAYQTYGGVNMYQNGGQAGVMGTFYKNNLISSLMFNGGGYVNDMYANGARDTVGNWFVGLSSKTAYNIELPKDFILQPTILFSYNYFGDQKWGTDYGSMAMVSNGLNGLNMAPGLNLIYNKKTWSIYATTQLMFNLVNGCTGTAGNVDLPTIKMGSTYFTYGIGFTKRVKDRLSFYGQVLFSNGVRTGVGFQGGVQWKF